MPRHIAVLTLGAGLLLASCRATPDPSAEAGAARRSAPAVTPAPAAVAPPAPVAPTLADVAGNGAPEPEEAVEPEPLERLEPLPPGTTPLSARLVAEIGAGLPVAILPTPIGLAAMSSDGVRGALLTSGEVLWALVDEVADVVWYGLAAVADDGEERSELWLLDLTAQAAQPWRVAKGLERYVEVDIVYPRGKDTSTRISWPTLRYGVRLDVVMDPRKPRFEAGGGVYADMGIADAEAHARAVRKARPDAATTRRLRELAERASGADPGGRPGVAPKVPAAPTPPARIDVPGACEGGSDVCGTVTEFANTPYWLVVVAYSCGDACHETRQLFDPKRRVFVSATTPDRVSAQPLPVIEEDVRGAIVSADGSAFVMDARIHRVGRWPIEPPLPQGSPGSMPSGGGWLGGQTNVW